MLTIHLDLVNHKLLSKLRIYENMWIKHSVAIQLVFWFLQYRTRPVVTPDTSDMFRTETLLFLSLAKLDTSDRGRTETINPQLVILRLALVFLVYLHLDK